MPRTRLTHCSSLEFEPAVTTHKMSTHFRPMRFDREAVTQLVRQRVIWERDLGAAVAEFCAYVSVDTTPAAD